jgi:hypothetical protein
MKERDGPLGEMSLSLFEHILRKQCKEDYADLKDGTRQARLQKDRSKGRSMKDMIKEGIDVSDLTESCLRTFGGTLEKAAKLYAKAMGATLFPAKVGSIQIDTLWEYRGVRYDLESKTNINLDKGKSRDTKSDLSSKRKVAKYSFRNSLPMVSGIVVWSQPTGEKASALAKKSLKNTRMFGYLDFFKIFDVSISEEAYKQMIRRVWKQEIEACFGHPTSPPVPQLKLDFDEEK